LDHDIHLHEAAPAMTTISTPSGQPSASTAADRSRHLLNSTSVALFALARLESAVSPLTDLERVAAIREVRRCIDEGTSLARFILSHPDTIPSQSPRPGR
jgi:hypothetical protein